MFPSLIEKAYAKLHYGYENLQHLTLKVISNFKSLFLGYCERFYRVRIRDLSDF